jgi:hypothetical protein
MASNASTGRVLWYNPNPTDNVPIQNEELNVFVKLSVETKGKSVIVNSTLQNTGGSGENEISFLSGTKKNEGDDPYLTTDYTNLQSYSLNGDEDYSEMLGIESINIDFNSSMAPMIKIKLIDVRGAAIFGKNGKGKYDFFFQMPYPLFHLELKGYYGYPIEYCLHLIRFNSNFNSQTGNFEIECDFIGYTYALLNDMQMSLLRACENTKIGKKKFQEIKSEYKDPSSILTIDETIKKISSINDVASTIKKDDADVKSINKINAIILDCDKLKENIKTFINDVSSSFPNFSSDFKSDYYCHGRVSGNFIAGESEEWKKYVKIRKDFQEKQFDLVHIKSDSITNKLTPELKPIFTQLLSETGDITYKSYTFYGSITNITGNISTDYDTDLEQNDSTFDDIKSLYRKDKPYYEDIKNTIINKLQVDGYDKYTYIFLDFRVAIDKINKFIGELNNEKINKENSIALKTKAQLNKKFGFDSSIRNLFRVLTTSVEVFLSSMMDVSFNAEQSSVRKGELGKLINNFNYVSNSEDKIFPWPEYRAKKEDGSYYEKYLGIDVNKNNVPELLFTEELIDIMITQAKEDKTYLNAINGISGANVGKKLWWPISVVDGNIPIGTQGVVLEVNKNPYEVILGTREELYKGNADSAKLLMILRGFLLLGFANRNDISNDLITLHAKLEAWNLKNAIDNVMSGNNAWSLKNEINSLTYEAIEKFGLHKDRVVDNDIFQEAGTKFKYSYILSKEGKSYLPINKGFNKINFYKDNKFLEPNDAIKLKESGYLFVGHDYDYKPSKANDGAIYVNIIDADKVDGKNHVPSFGQESLAATNYSTKYAGKKISYSNFSKALNGNDNTTLYVNPLDANKSINVYSEINYVVPYDNPNGSPNNGVGDDLGNLTTLPLFFADVCNNTTINRIKSDDYYNNIIIQINPSEFEKFVYLANVKDKDLKLEQKLSYTEGNMNYITLYAGEDAKPSGFRTKLVQLIANAKSPDVTHTIPFIGYNFNTSYKISLFGSAFYYSQYTTPEEIKKNYPKQTSDELKETAEKLTTYKRAFLFLHCFPFQGVVKPKSYPKTHTMFDGSFNDNVLGLKALFQAHNGLIKAPKAWVLFIGAILWRLEFKDDPINFSELFLEKGGEPKQNEFLYSYEQNNKNNPYCGMNILQRLGEYSKIDDVLINLPKQVKNEFINYFKNWAIKDFYWIRIYFEITYKFDDFKTIRDKYRKQLEANDGKISYNEAKTILGENNSIDNYIYIGVDYKEIYLADGQGNGNNFIMEYNPYSSMMQFLVKTFLTSYTYIQNINPRIWSKPEKDGEGKYKKDPILVEKDKFKHYVTGFTETFKTLVSGELTRAPEEIKEIKTELFGTADNDDIRLNVYRTLMAIYQKWISGTQSGGFFSQCMVHPNDSKIANHERNSLTTGSKLIESFRFVDRAYFDIGDKLYINPKTFSDLIIKNKGATFFDVSNRILNDNNFLFLPLPSFVNFNDVSELQKIFEPQMMSESKQGPSFVCIYAGQISNHLELNDDVYKDDGIYINVDKDGNLTGLPEDFAKAKDVNPYEMNVPVFAVNFGQQNQNFFKDIKLDQKEFSETSESLEIIQDLSNAGDKTKVTSIGQNLFNVYQKRSYSCEVEMMGNLAIQPLMYFQLNNIPMFKGLYLIIKVSHTVKANSISTTFKGVRVKKTKTPLIENNTVLLNLTNTSSTNTNATSSGGGSIVVGVNSFGPTACTPWSRTSITPAETKRNIITVIAYLKAQGLNQYQIVGALGNMHHETGGTFNQNAGNPADNNGTTDYGIIQYNSGRWPNDPDCAKGSSEPAASIGCIRCKIGDTIEKQMDYTYNQYNKFKTWLAREEPKNDVYQSAYLFANIVEVCSFCGDEASFNASNRYNTVERYNQAKIYFNRFNDPNDELYWDNIQPMVFSNQPINSSTKTNIVIGDSLAPNVLKGISKAGDDTFEILTQLQESGLSAETFLSNKLNNYNTKNDNIKNVVVSLGTNGIFNTTASVVDKIYAKLKTLFPNAKLMIVKGTYGNLATWSRSLTTVTQQTVNTYYTSFQSKDFFVINPAIGNLKNAHTYAPIYKEIGSNIIVNKK